MVTRTTIRYKEWHIYQLISQQAKSILLLELNDKVMTQNKLISLYSDNTNIFFVPILPIQAENILGGDTVLDLSTIHDGVNNLSNKFPSLLGMDNNKVFTFDFSRLTINLVVMLSDAEAQIRRWMM